MNLEQLLDYLACDVPTNSLLLRLHGMSHLKMLMKCLNGGNTLAWVPARAGILMSVQGNSWMKDFHSSRGSQGSCSEWL